MDPSPITGQSCFCSPYIQSPLLLQYDPQFGDAFWNSSKYGMVTYLLRMMTSWAIVCSVWYLPPMTREVGVSSPPVWVCCGGQESGSVLIHSLLQKDEDAVQFANRVKSAIARQGGLVDLLWWVELIPENKHLWAKGLPPWPRMNLALEKEWSDFFSLVPANNAGTVLSSGTWNCGPLPSMFGLPDSLCL